MSSTPATRIVAMIAALAVVLAGLLPVAHLHADDEQSLVHRHLIGAESTPHSDEADDHQASFDHADHGDAQVLSLSYDHARPYAGIGCPLAVSRALVAPQVTAAAPANRRTLLPTHDPPIRFVSSPAPPAVV